MESSLMIILSDRIKEGFKWSKFCISYCFESPKHLKIPARN